MNKDFESIYQQACNMDEGVAPYEGMISHLLAKAYNDRDEAIVCAFLAGVLFNQEQRKG